MTQTTQDLIEQYVSEIKKIYGTHLRQIILYGSYARGDFESDSDIDIMILLDMSDLELKAYSQQLSYITYDFNLDNDLDIKPIAKSEAHFRKWLVNYPFYANIHKEGVVLYGQPVKSVSPYCKVENDDQMTEQKIREVAIKFAEEAKRIYGSKLHEIILYGSCARGDFEKDSDIDILVLLDVPQEDITIERERIWDVANQIDWDYDVVLAPVFQNYQLYQKYMPVSQFYQNVQREGIRIV